jgi:hypothetical protein
MTYIENHTADISGGQDYDRQLMERRLAWLERATRLLDDQFVIPGTNFRFGIDPLLGMFPGLGDIISYVISAFIVLFALNYSADMGLFWRMMLNIMLDVLAGYIPVVGDLADFTFKANRRNMILLRQHLGLPAVALRTKSAGPSGESVTIQDTVSSDERSVRQLADARPLKLKRAALWVFVLAFLLLLLMMVLLILGAWKLGSLVYGLVFCFCANVKKFHGRLRPCEKSFTSYTDIIFFVN